MNQPKKMTKCQEEYVLANGLKPDEWFFLEEDEKFLLIVRKATGKSRWIPKKEKYPCRLPI